MLLLYIHTCYITSITTISLCPSVYVLFRHTYNNGFVATHALGHIMYGTSRAQVHELPQSHCDNREGTLFS